MKPTINLLVNKDELQIIVKHSGVYTETFHISLDLLKKHLKAAEEGQHVRLRDSAMPPTN